jgi:peptidoglycan hydrolase-like protein with peptidoglycan-binding domain/curli biogenesis system outer membrane secretion channel CsgG
MLLLTKPLRAWLGAALLPILVAGCMTAPEKAPQLAKPKRLPVKNFTSFSDSLRCMDNLFASFGVRDLVITSAGLPDATGEISTGTKDMMISAISTMSVRSRAFRFVDFDQFQVDVHQLQALVGFTDDFLVPNYYIRGAITQLDSGIIAEQVGGSVSSSAFSFGASTDQVVSVVSIDMNIGDLVTRQIQPGLSAHNSIAVARSGAAGDLGGQIQSYGVFLNLSFNRAEGMHAAVRNLVELSTIEVLGKLAEVPYWRCLSIEQTNPAVEAQARVWFDDMSSRERVVFAQRALKSAGYFEARVSGEFDAATKGAVGRYQADHGLLADGRINFDLYASLINQDLAIGRQPGAGYGADGKAAADIRPNPLRLTLATPKGANPSYQVGETLDLTLVSSQDAYVYCYYSDAVGNVVRLFPNQFQPDALAIGGRSIAIPSQGARFDIVFDRANVTEEVVCLGSPIELGMQLPPRFKVPDLTGMPVDSLDEVVSAYRDLDRTGLTQARVAIAVQN